MKTNVCAISKIYVITDFFTSVDPTYCKIYGIY